MEQGATPPRRVRLFQLDIVSLLAQSQLIYRFRPPPSGAPLDTIHTHSNDGSPANDFVMVR